MTPIIWWTVGVAAVSLAIGYLAGAWAQGPVTGFCLLFCRRAR